MPRDYAKFRTDIVGDNDFRELTPLGQHLYYTLSIDPTLTHCGVVDWRPARIAYRAKGWTADGVNESAFELITGLFIVVDESTEEALVRSHIKHDELMKNPRQAVSMMNAYAGVASRTLRGVIVHEVKKLYKNQPELACWASKFSGAKLRDFMRREAIDPAELTLNESTIYPKNFSSIKGKPESVKGSTSPIPKPEPISTYVDITTTSPIDEDGFEYPCDLTALTDVEAQTTKPKLATKAKPIRTDVEQLCELLRDRILDNGNRAPKTISEDWRKHARLLLDKDGVTFAQASAVIEWCQADDFWRPNILSMPKLRAKYPQLEAKAREAYRQPSTVAAPRPTSQQTQRDSLDEIFAQAIGDTQPTLTAVPDLVIIEGLSA